MGAATQPGDRITVSGPGRGYTIDTGATAFLLAGDESAIPAICQLLEHLREVPISVHISVTHSDAVVDLHRDVNVEWHIASGSRNPQDSVLETIRALDVDPGMWV